MNLRIDFRRTARLMLTAALVLTTVARGSTGEALVLHQHGLRRAHLHVLAYSQLLQDPVAALSGGSANAGKAERAIGGVQVLAVILIGTAAITVDPQDTAPGPQDVPCLAAVRPFFVAPPAALIGAGDIPSARSASAAILLRNHSLLL